MEAGVALFNAGDPFAAHEEWEALWLALPRDHPQRDFYQGLIQLAAALVKLERGRPRGTLKLLRRGGAKLSPPCPAFARAYDVERLAGEAGALEESIAAAGGDAVDAADPWRPVAPPADLQAKLDAGVPLVQIRPRTTAAGDRG